MGNRIIRYIPNALVVLRIAIAIYLAIDALDRTASAWFVTAYIIAALSDMFDGMIARKLKAISEIGSRMDAQADFILYIAILFCIWMIHREVVQAFLIPISVVCSTQAISWLLSIIRFGKLTSYHSVTDKIWAVILFITIISIFGFGYAGILFWLAIIMGIISNIQDMAITLVMPYWSRDILSIRQAIRLREMTKK